MILDAWIISPWAVGWVLVICTACILANWRMTTTARPEEDHTVRLRELPGGIIEIECLICTRTVQYRTPDKRLAINLHATVCREEEA